LEPYAGGAGAATRLLASGAASEIYLNDRDPRVYAAWMSILYENDRFVDELASRTPDINAWRACKQIVDSPYLARDRFELGFAAFFLNRTNRSGILQGAAPIGGYEQSGEWKLDARFYRETLLSRVRWLGTVRHRIHLTRLDGLRFLRRMASANELRRSLFFIDPPYVGMGSRLYLNAMQAADHQSLAEFLCSGAVPNWIVTYDDDPFVRKLYATQHVATKDVRYTLHRKRQANEVVIRPKGTQLIGPLRP
jgi:DNA adenine methylase